MSYMIKLSYSDEFAELIEEARDKFGEKVLEIDGIGRKNLDINNLSKQFFKNNSFVSFTVDPNANVTFSESILMYMSEIHKGTDRLNAYYVLYNTMKKLYNEELAKKAVLSNISGDIYIHDFHTFALNSYCFAFSALDIVEKGLPFLGDKLPVGPIKHASSFINVIIQAISYYSNSIAGAVAFPDFFGVLAYLINKDIKEGYMTPPEKNKEKYKNELKQLFQNFIFGINWPFRSGVQSAFVNLNILDKSFIKSMFAEYFMKEDQIDYKPSVDQIDRLQRDFLEYFFDLLKTNLFTFPVITASLVEDYLISYTDTATNENKEFYFTKSENSLSENISSYMSKLKEMESKNQIQNLKITRVVEDQEFLKYLLDINKETMMINFYVGKLGQLSTCCRLRNDTTEIKEIDKVDLRLNKEEMTNQLENSYFNSFGSGNDVKIGSHRVVTINLPRIALKSKTKDTFMQNLKEVLNIAQKILHVQRYIVEQRILQKKLPLYSYGFMDLKRQFSTIGIIGTFEMVKLMGYDIGSEEGQEFLKNIVDYINNENKKESYKFSHPYNLEQVPGESASYKLLQKDKIQFKNIFKYDLIKDMQLYSNQLLPLIYDCSLEDRIKIQGKFDAKLTGGAILHINIGSSLTLDQSYKLFNFIVEKGVVYFAFNPVFSVCKNKHVYIGKTNKCPTCGEDIKDYYTRIVGFLVPVSSWAEVRKKEDFPNRVFYDNNG